MSEGSQHSLCDVSYTFTVYDDGEAEDDTTAFENPLVLISPTHKIVLESGVELELTHEELKKAVCHTSRNFLPADIPSCSHSTTISMKCMTRVYHYNINTIGDICLDLLKDKGTPLLTTTSILLSFSQLLVEPNPFDPLMGRIADKYKGKRTKHDKMAKLFTRKYATPSKKSAQSKKPAVHKE